MRYRDFIQNITITFLALLSLFLFSRTQFFQLGAAAGSGTWQRLTAPVSDQISDAPSSDTLSAPVRAAVTGEYGRYGSISLTTDSESFTPIKTLLREVLGSARSRMDSSAAAFRSALGKPSVYCDFLEPLPVSYLADLMGITAVSFPSALWPQRSRTVRWSCCCGTADPAITSASLPCNPLP